ncbi:ABC transporter substrate-binding protein [Sinorhizobium medicae]|uniref:ABC transporter, binding protein n=1 Tax=Sinorhizobium medicae (strain WSM419) TaxID=366394 RepID=A6U7I1_SINMW|nr:ABC transporter substrate-binding protein [Sinorhizobium medicae]ABR59611.1 ABC transporter, binding protein [Sinorhizobium medicae WSM419]MDX0404237.1 extracellular solute-binding protein [Sinorhizobium medicae]MDX0410175.1 extracellular solute-binding protein [Sinorhizobium medicae]MDX0416591.1 extracellular solute-binding protein [Sinorhizobium medicae]MDX0433919.1 extracellular solute-binding protein [Sinorhizobium medicae]
MNEAFQRDCIEILADKVKRGEMTRRRFAQLAAMLVAGAPLALRAGGAAAQAKQLVFVNWGGDAITAYDKAYGQPFLEEAGITVRQDGSGPTEGAITAQFKSGAPSWDIVDADPFSAITLGKQGMIEEIDYSVVDKNKMRPGFGWDYAASSYFFSYVIAYDSEKYGDNPPKGMADFFDVNAFPGKRSLYKWGSAMWEAALLGDGVAPEKLYPLDLKRAHDKIAAFKENVVAYWGGGSESQSLLLDGEASMALIWSTRASLIEQDSGGRIKFIWDQGLLSPGAMAVIKGNPGGRDAAMKFIASAQDPQKQLVMFDLLRQGPANPAADALIPEEQKRQNPVDPANMSKQIPLNMEWYAEHYGPALNEFTKIVSA